MKVSEVLGKAEAVRRSVVIEFPEYREALARWSFTLDNAKRRFGRCRHSLMTISLSRYLVRLNTWERVELTVRHELAHAIVGSRHGHDATWRSTARRLGHSGQRCYDAAETVTPTANWIGTCPKGHTAERMKRPRSKPVSCGQCAPYFDERFKFTWARKVVSTTTGGRR